jgi:hypothetical protein
MTINIWLQASGYFHWCKRQISRLREERNSASRWKTVAFYRHHASANAKASGLRRSVE